MAEKGKNQNLYEARSSKKDEFYTQLSDIEKEMKHYKQHFRGKVVYCNCDDPRKYGELAGLPLAAHLHMLRNACGYALADQGADMRLIQDYLGYRNIQHTVIYTAANPAKFEKL